MVRSVVPTRQSLFACLLPSTRLGVTGALKSLFTAQALEHQSCTAQIVLGTKSLHLCTGFHRKYIKYTVTTSTDLKTFGYSPVQVVRRFSDFVDLENLLKVRCPTAAAATHRPLLIVGVAGLNQPENVASATAECLEACVHPSAVSHTPCSTS